MPPSASPTDRTAADMEDSSVTSSASFLQPLRSRPSSDSSRRAVAYTVCPLLERCSAVARPIPDEQPVMSTVCPALVTAGSVRPRAGVRPSHRRRVGRTARRVAPDPGRGRGSHRLEDRPQRARDPAQARPAGAGDRPPHDSDPARGGRDLRRRLGDRAAGRARGGGAHGRERGDRRLRGGHRDRRHRGGATGRGGDRGHKRLSPRLRPGRGPALDARRPGCRGPYRRGGARLGRGAAPLLRRRRAGGPPPGRDRRGAAKRRRDHRRVADAAAAGAARRARAGRAGPAGLANGLDRLAPERRPSVRRPSSTRERRWSWARRPGMRALVTGATGFVGGLLARRLLGEGTEVRCLVRDSGRAQHLADAGQDVDVAYYLVHGMGRGSDKSFAERERETARNFARTMKREGVDRMVYLGGLGENPSSEHLRSRHETGQILGEEGPDLTYFRAAMVVGPGSESYKTLRYLVKRLPVMIAPSWLDTPTQPIDGEDVVSFLSQAPSVEDSRAREIQIGGPDVLSYKDMLDRMAEALGRRPR